MIQGLTQYSLNKDLQASQMTATKVMDIVSRLPGCAGHAADAVSASTQIKMEEAPKLLKIPESEWPTPSTSRKRSNKLKPIGRVQFTKAVARHANIRDKKSIAWNDLFAQVILSSVTPMLQNLRIGLKKRRNGKSNVPVKQRGSWPKIS